MKMMKYILGLLLSAAALPVQADLNIFACEPEWAALAQELGGDKVSVYSATTAYQDPHRIEARPSLIAKVRRADLLVCSGAELETGWLPMLLRQAGNAKVQRGQAGYFEAAERVERLEIPTEVDRGQGDVHASGNPHVHLDPHRLLLIAEALQQRFSELDSANRAHYQQRMDDFRSRWTAAMQGWTVRAAPLKGKRLVVQHRNWAYLFDWLGLQEAGTLEPKPGLPTSSGYLAGLKQHLEENPAQAIIHTAYQESRAADWLAGHTGLPVIELPYTVGGSDKASDLFGLFDDTLDKLLVISGPEPVSTPASGGTK